MWCIQTGLLFAQAVNAANAPILPIMLSTMALPEMEAEEKGLLSQTDASMAAMSDQELHASLAVRQSCLQQSALQCSSQVSCMAVVYLR